MEKQSITQTLNALVLVLLIGNPSFGVVALSQGGESTSDPNWVLAERFRFTWDSVELSSRVTNPDASENAELVVPTRAVDISVALEILDTNDLVAMYVERPQILSVVDGLGRPVQCVPQGTSGVRAYERVEWRSVSEGGHLVSKLQPSTLTVHLELEPNQPLPLMLSAVRGQVCAVYAEDVIEADVPFAQTVFTLLDRPAGFDPNEGWIDVGHDLRIRVRTANAAFGHAWYQTEVSATSGAVRGLGFVTWRGVGDFMLLGIRICNSDGGLAQDSRSLNFFPSETESSVWCYGEAAHPEPGVIRHFIAVSPVEVKIPFELTDILIPSVEPVAR